MKKETKFSIITPSFKQPDWLKLCIRSVADQSDQNSNFSIEHIVQDAGTPGLEEFAAQMRSVEHQRYSLKVIGEKDSGMYDAVNRGLRKSTGQICAYLNCDEQYLPGALDAVLKEFENDPQLDILFADVVVVDGSGGYVCSRRVVVPHYYHTAVCQLNTFTAAMFFRRSVFDGGGLFFDTEWRDVGDGVWVLQAMKRGMKMRTIRRYTSVFADDGGNMGMKPNAIEEKNRLRSRHPLASALSPAIVAHHRLRRLVAGIYAEKPYDYAIYTPASPDRRHEFHVKNPTQIYASRFSWTR